MATDYYLWFDKPSNGPEVKGESKDAFYGSMGSMGSPAKNAIEIKTLKWGVGNKASFASGFAGSGAGKAVFDEVEVSFLLERCAPVLYKACCTGIHFPKAYLAFRKARGGDAKGSSGEGYQTITLALVFITHFSTGNEGNDGDPNQQDGPMVRMRMAFGASEVKYRPIHADGKFGAAIVTEWSQVLSAATLNVK